jgi:hypothetical protein
MNTTGSLIKISQRLLAAQGTREGTRRAHIREMEKYRFRMLGVTVTSRPPRWEWEVSSGGEIGQIRGLQRHVSLARRRLESLIPNTRQLLMKESTLSKIRLCSGRKKGWRKGRWRPVQTCNGPSTKCSVDEWIARQEMKMDRSQAIRRVVELGLKAETG